ncbi:MAG: hypothetical protein A3K83_06755 [Omnitrophica WOR_2 bacterium RBG_13_44_8b]|nr:MAG: hypothetical protein A3K83_06755 [Omnitrophica WOR_2 bacterium RBG_13_44_8b]
MLRVLRNKKTAKWIWIALAVIVVPAFVLWGSGSLTRSKEEGTYAGTIFGKKVTFLEYRDALEAVKNMAIMQFGDKFSEMRQFLNLEGQAWERLIMLYEAKRRKIKASDREVITLIQSYPFFQRNKRFDTRSYKEILRYVFNTQARAFEEETRQDIMISKLYSQVTRGLRLQEDEIKYEYEKANQEISLYYIAAVAADFSKDINPSDQQIQDYFNENLPEFKQPLSFNLDYITSESEEAIKDISAKLKKSEDLEKWAKEMGLEIKQTGFFTQTEPVTGIGWSPEIINMVSRLQVGQFMPYIHIDKNYYIFRLKGRKETYIPDFLDVKEKVKAALIKKEAEKIAKQKIESCLVTLKDQYKQDHKSVDFDKIAKENGLKAGSTDNFKYGSYIEGIGASDALWIKAKELKEGEFSDPLKMPSGFYIIEVKSIVPIDEKKFENDKEQFIRELLSQKKQGYFVEFLEELKRKALVN